MIKVIEQKEIKELEEILQVSHVIPVHLAKAFLRKRGKDDEHIEIILNQMIKTKKAFYDTGNYYLRVNKAYKPSEMNPGIVKSLWLLTDLLQNVSEYFIQQRNPHTLTFIKKEEESDNPFYDIFYIPRSSEQINCFRINDMIKKSGNDAKIFVILDDEKQKNLIKFDEKIQVCAFVTVESDGTIKYL